MDLRVTDLNLSSVFKIHAPLHEYERGALFCIYCWESFANVDMALPDNLTSVSISRLASAARGLLFQRSPFAEHKFVTCIAIPMFGVVDDLRCDTLASGRRTALNLVAEKIQSVDIPPGWMHGLQALTDGTVVVYQIRQSWRPKNEHGIKWDNRILGTDWQIAATEISDRDTGLPAFSEKAFS